MTPFASKRADATRTLAAALLCLGTVALAPAAAHADGHEPARPHARMEAAFRCRGPEGHGGKPVKRLAVYCGSSMGTNPRFAELKRLAVPASVDSIPSSAMQEDHVSMGWSAARKLRRAVDGLTRVLAVELLTAARGPASRVDLPLPQPPLEVLGGRSAVRTFTVDTSAPSPTLGAPADGAGQLNRAGIEQQLLGQRRLARIGVRNDGERPPARYIAHEIGGKKGLAHRGSLRRPQRRRARRLRPYRPRERRR